MRSADLEKRVAALEAEVTRLKHDLASSSAKQQPWWEETSGVFADDPAFEEAMRLGLRMARFVQNQTVRTPVVVLDTDHLSLLERRASASSNHLRIRLSKLDAELRATMIITYEEQTRGWMAYKVPGLRVEDWTQSGEN